MRTQLQRFYSIALGFGCFCFLSEPNALANSNAASVDSRSFRPSTDGSGSFATESVKTPGPWNLHLNGWFSLATPFLKVTEKDGSQKNAIQRQWLFEPAFSLGLGTRFSIGATLPVILTQDGSVTELTAPRTPPRQAIGDITLTGKANLMMPDRDFGGWGLAALIRVTVPTGDRYSWVHESSSSIEARGLVSYDVAHTLITTATFGFRGRTSIYNVYDLTIGNSIPWGITFGFKPQALGIDKKGRWTWMLESHGELGIPDNRTFKDGRLSPVLLGVSARWELDRYMALFGGVETSLTSAWGAPDFRGTVGILFSPRVIDEDHDGVPDDRDECPGLPEDGLGAHPHDGCPDFSKKQTPASPHTDSDYDGIPDIVDSCPNRPTDDPAKHPDGC